MAGVDWGLTCRIRIIGVRQSVNVGVAKLLAAGVATCQGGKSKGAAIKLLERGKLVSQMVLDDRA